jgi:PAS domain S-box-containing protein
MRIKKRLQLNVAISVMTAVVICLMLFLALQRITSVSGLTKAAGDLTAGILDRVVLGNDYIRNNNPRAKEQWFAKHEQVDAVLKRAAISFHDVEDRKIISDMIEDHQAIGRIFSAIVANREKTHTGAYQAGLSSEVEERLLNQLNIRAYEVTIQINKLLESARMARSSVFRESGWEIVSLLVFLIAAAMFNSWTMGRAITARAARLREGAVMIGSGDLEHRIDVKGDDEFAELSESFNAMTAKLRGSYRDLENEVRVRKRAEEELRENQSRLEAVFAAIPNVMIEFDTAGSPVRATTAALKVIGLSSLDFSRDQAVAKLEFRNLDGSYVRSEDLPTSRAFRGEIVSGDLYSIRTAGGVERTISAYAAPLYKEDGSVSGALALWHDITDLKRAEDELRRSQKRNEFLAEILQQSSQPFAVGYSDGSIGLFNQAFEQLTGYSAEELGRIDWAKALTPPEWLASELASLEELNHTGQPVRYQKEYIRKDGSRVPIELLVHMARDNEGKPDYYYSFLTDISERKRAEEALQLSEEKFAKAFAGNPAAIALTSLEDGLFLDVNDTWVALTGYSREEAIGHSARKMRIWPTAEATARFVQTLREKGSLRGWEEHFLKKSGEDFVAALSAQILTLRGESVILSTLVDITARKRAEAALQESEERLRLLGNNLPDSAVYQYMHDPDGKVRFLYFSAGVERLNGVKVEDVLADAGTLHRQIPHDYIERLVEVETKSARELSDFDMELPMRHSDGQVRWMRLHSRPRRLPDGHVIWDGVQTDVTERKRAEESLQKTRDLLAKQVEERTRELREKEVLLKEVHHRVKNNLQVISSLVGLQADGSGDETVREVLRDVNYRVRSMALIHEKLYQSESLSRIDFAEYIRGLLSYLWRAHGAGAADVRLTLDLEPVLLSVDTAVPCGLILNELAGNALKHAFRGRSEGEVTVSLKGSVADRLHLCVRDNGVGLPPGFDWRQASSLGLRLVQMLSGQLGATVEADNGEGTRFEVTFGPPS